ncbi:MAG: hypothetical protein CMH57_02530 [Myxococcales bacterium]|nr:hypothetical protein [Myxococcales bacterium]
MSYRHDLPTDEREHKVFAVPTDLGDRVRSYARRSKGLSQNTIACAAMELQLIVWRAQQLSLENPITREKTTKAAGEDFPSAPPSLSFDKGGPGLAAGETRSLSVRADPQLMHDWLAAVWYQQARYSYPSEALVAGLTSYLDQVQNTMPA